MKPKWFYMNREERSEWLAERFSECFTGAKNVLDVGCGIDKHLKKFVPAGVKYVGMDAVGEPEMKVDFDKGEKFPFADGEFDLVVCADVLEHLEKIHFVLNEILRASNKWVVISLPIPARPTILKKIIFSERLKRYGLPLEVPADRHRWFYTYQEMVDFISHFADKNGFIIKVFETDADYSWQNMGVIKKTIGSIKKKFVASLGIFLLEKK
jgi:SAM-dependent methyltransferase